MENILVLCPTRREYRDLPGIAANLNCQVIFDELAVDYFYEVLSCNYEGTSTLNILELIEDVLKRHASANLAGVTSADGYPGMCAASIIAKRLGLNAPKTDRVLLCGHKYYSRVEQRALVPQATPSFQLLDPRQPNTWDQVREFPVFLKPVRSCFSINANRVDNFSQLQKLASKSLLPEGYLKPFNELLKAHTGFELDASYLMVESLLQGTQVTVEGYVLNGRVHIIGIVDSIMFPGTIHFKRFQYPSALSAKVQLEMEQIATTFISGIGFDNGLFNMEMMYNPNTSQIHIIEVNPRIASQFPDLYQKVDGQSSYTVMLQVALGQEPAKFRQQGQFALAASCVLRVFEDQEVLAVPPPEQIAALKDRFPDAIVEIHAVAGKRLSDQMQDVGSYRYGLVNIGANSQQELEEKFEICKQLLQFRFASVESDSLPIEAQLAQR